METKTQWTMMHCFFFARLADDTYAVVRNSYKPERTLCGIFASRKEAIAYTEEHNPWKVYLAKKKEDHIASMIAELRSLGYKVTKR